MMARTVVLAGIAALMLLAIPGPGAPAHGEDPAVASPPSRDAAAAGTGPEAAPPAAGQAATERDGKAAQVDGQRLVPDCVLAAHDGSTAGIGTAASPAPRERIRLREWRPPETVPSGQDIPVVLGVPGEDLTDAASTRRIIEVSVACLKQAVRKGAPARYIHTRRTQLTQGETASVYRGPPWMVAVTVLVDGKPTNVAFRIALVRMSRWPPAELAEAEPREPTKSRILRPLNQKMLAMTN